MARVAAEPTDDVFLRRQVLIIDCDADCFGLQPKHGIFIPKSEGEAREYLQQLPYYYNIQLRAQEMLVFNNSACIHQFRNVNNADGEQRARLRARDPLSRERAWVRAIDQGGRRGKRERAREGVCERERESKRTSNPTGGARPLLSRCVRAWQARRRRRSRSEPT